MKCPKHSDVECAPSRTRCRPCLDRLRDHQRERRKRLIEANRCVGTVTRSKCENPPREGKKMCQECADTLNKYQLERIAARKKETK